VITYKRKDIKTLNHLICLNIITLMAEVLSFNQFNQK
jgi:hypothetical protein